MPYLSQFATYSFIALNIPLKIAAKPLETWLLLTIYRKSPPPFPMVPSPTLYDFPFIHNNAWMAYHSALLPFKVIQGQWYISHVKASMRPPIMINSNLGLILHRLATVHPWQTDRWTAIHANSSTFTKVRSAKNSLLHFLYLRKQCLDSYKIFREYRIYEQLDCHWKCEIFIATGGVIQTHLQFHLFVKYDVSMTSLVAMNI